MRRFDDRAAEFVPTVERVFGVPPRVVDDGSAAQVGDVKLRLDDGERELWVMRAASGREEPVAVVEVEGDIELAVREAKERLA